MVFLIYSCAAALALLLLYMYQAHWYWHVLSVGTAISIGFMPAGMIPGPASWGATRDMTIGAVFVFLMVWGLCPALFRHHHHEPHAVH